MKLVHQIAMLAFGGAFLAGCNPNADQADTTVDETAAPAAPADMPATPDASTVPGPDETLAPPADPAYQPPPSDAATPPEPNQEPAPPPNQ